MQDGEACDDGVNDGSYGGCEPGCAMAGPYCGDGVVQTSDGELCDGDCSTTCEPLDACDTAESSGSAQACTLQCMHTTVTTCDDGDGCCPGGCSAGNDDDCDPMTVNVTLCVRNDNSVVVVPSEITAPFNSNLRIHWTNVCNREVWVVNFRFGTTWSQLAVLGPGESTSPDVGVAEGPWCYLGGVEYRLGGLAYPADDKGYLLLHCTE